jgi:hypothetical protein
MTGPRLERVPRGDEPVRAQQPVQVLVPRLGPVRVLVPRLGPGRAPRPEAVPVPVPVRAQEPQPRQEAGQQVPVKGQARELAPRWTWAAAEALV